MGEIADAMLDGTLCVACGAYIEGEGDGIPRYCSPQCAMDQGAEYYDGSSRRRTRLYDCQECGKRFRSEQAVRDHTRDAHPASPPQEG